ncbi:MAG: hypothetical protein AB198_00365 [Parcubacteria bacterium C7867-003]|nr:MAG: hypothetical protein AB198_00365 [Parcubacteria bacterium C7867-003]
MRIVVKVKPSSKKEGVERLTQSTLDLGLSKEMDVYKVLVKEPPVDGKVNRAVVKALSEYFEVSPSLITLIKGETSKNKVFEILK